MGRRAVNIGMDAEQRNREETERIAGWSRCWHVLARAETSSNNPTSGPATMIQLATAINPTRNYLPSTSHNHHTMPALTMKIFYLELGQLRWLFTIVTHDQSKIFCFKWRGLVSPLAGDILYSWRYEIWTLFVRTQHFFIAALLQIYRFAALWELGAPKKVALLHLRVLFLWKVDIWW